MTTPRRVQLRRTKGWRMPPNTVSVARPGRWGNPYRVAPAFEGAGVKIPEITAETAVQLFREVWDRRLRDWPLVASRSLEMLRGKNLACWCPPGAPCHADVLIELANR